MSDDTDRDGSLPRSTVILLLGCGLALLASLSAVAVIEPISRPRAFLGLAGIASAAYLLALWCVARGLPSSRRLLGACLLLAVAWRVPLVVAPPLLSTDVYRYVWDGRVQRLGLNPYVSAPADPSLDEVHTSVTRLTDHAELPTIYPPAAELFFRLVASLGETVLAFKLAALACDLAVIGLLLGWLAARDRSRWWVLAYAWHPLVALEGAGSGHVDLLGVALLVGGALALHARRSVIAVLVLTLSVAVKFLPVVLAPLVLRRFTWQQVALGVGVLAGLYLWFAPEPGGVAVGSLGDYARRWRFNGPAFLAIESVAGMRVALAMPVLVGLSVSGYMAVRWEASTDLRWALPLAATLAFMPAIYPWYLVWLVPFLGRRETAPLTAWTLLALATYVVWESELRGTGWVLPTWVMFVEYGVVGAVAAYVIWVSRVPSRSAR